VSDELLVARARRGEPAAVEQLLTEHSPRIHTICRRMCRNHDDALDAAQQAMVAVVRGLPRFDGRSAVGTWIHRITVNACLDELRRAGRRPSTVTLDAVGDAAEATELRGELARALASLPEEFRTAVVMRDVADLDYSTIAELTSAPVGTVRSRIARGRARLAEALGHHAPGNPPGTDGVRTTETP